MASSSANERANASKKLRTQRGKTVVLVFSNQGLGNMCNTAVILFLMAVTGQYGPHYNQREMPLCLHACLMSAAESLAAALFVQQLFIAVL